MGEIVRLRPAAAIDSDRIEARAFRLFVVEGIARSHEEARRMAQDEIEQEKRRVWN